MKYHDYLQTDYWKEVTKSVKSRAGWKCQLCNSPHDLNAHHRTYENRGNELNHLEDLICLCRRCHAMFHGKDEPIVPRCLSVGVAQPVRRGAKAARRAARLEARQAATTAAEADHAADMPEGFGDIIMTPELLHRLKTKAGGYTAKTLKAVGVSWPPLGGWPSRIMGQPISRGDYFTALKGRTRPFRH